MENKINNQDKFELKKQLSVYNNYVLTEKDFYPPQDDRLYCSGIDDIVDGDNFDDYAEWFYDNYEKEIFDN